MCGSKMMYTTLHKAFDSIETQERLNDASFSGSLPRTD